MTSYYKGSKLIIPFCQISTTYLETSIRLLVYTGSGSFSAIISGKSEISKFLDQYTAWLDSQSTPSL